MKIITDAFPPHDVFGNPRPPTAPKVQDFATLSDAAQNAIVDTVLGSPPPSLPDDVKAEIKAWAESP